MQTTSVHIDVETYGDLKRLASELHLSLGETLRYAIRRLNQTRIGDELSAGLSVEETQWLHADLG